MTWMFKTYYDIPAYFKPTNMLRQLLVCPKDNVDNLMVECHVVAYRLARLKDH